MQQNPSSTSFLALALSPEEIGRRIRRARENHGWTQFNLANEANVSPSTVQRWERGVLPPLRELIRLAGVLEIPTEELVESEEPSGHHGRQEEMLHQLLGEMQTTQSLLRQLMDQIRNGEDPSEPR